MAFLPPATALEAWEFWCHLTGPFVVGYLTYRLMSGGR